jgi:hypothetical protein
MVEIVLVNPLPSRILTNGAKIKPRRTAIATSTKTLISINEK